MIGHLTGNQVEFSKIIGKNPSAISKYRVRGIDRKFLIVDLGTVRHKFKINLRLEHFEFPVEDFSELMVRLMKEGKHRKGAEEEASAYREPNPACAPGEPAGEKPKLKKEGK